MKYIIEFQGGETQFLVSGTEAAGEAYTRACAFADSVSSIEGDDIVVSLLSEDGEVLATYGEEDPVYEPDFDLEEPEEDYDCYDLETGFNPYEGCYDYDC